MHVIMNCFLFCARCRNKSVTLEQDQLYSRAERIILRHCQQSAFPDEFNKIRRNEMIPANSKILPLNPYYDLDDDLLCARGRLTNADIPDDMKCPIILPANHRVTDLLIADTHRRNGHIGLKHVVSKLRERFWIIRCVTEVRKILRRCIFCTRHNRPLMTQQMAPLPAARTSAEHPPFHATGIDYFGPPCPSLASACEYAF